MIGSKQLVLSAEDILTRGMSSSDEIADGAFSPASEGINPLVTVGVIYGPASPADKSTNLSGDAIAWCETNVDNINGYILSDTGYIHSISSSQVLTAAASALTGTWTKGTSDIVQFIDKIYATSATDVARMDTNLTNGDPDWWSSAGGINQGVLTSGVRHPLLVFQDRLWIGDANALHNIVGSLSGNSDVLVLAAHHQITALGIDPSSGKMLIATTHSANYSGDISSGYSIFTYDGTSSTYTREYHIEGMVTGFKNVGGITFVMYGGTKIGYWNGSGITFLRHLNNVTLAGAELPYTHHITAIDQTLYVIDGTQVLAYGEVLPGQKIWYYAYKNGVNSNNLDLIFPAGSKLLGIGFESAKFYTLDTKSAGALRLELNKVFFDRPVYLRQAEIIYASAVANNDDNRNLYFKTNRTDGYTIMNLLGGTRLVNASGANIYEQEQIVGFPDERVRWVQMRYLGNDVGIKRIVVYYDPAE